VPGKFHFNYLLTGTRIFIIAGFKSDDSLLRSVLEANSYLWTNDSMQACLLPRLRQTGLKINFNKYEDLQKLIVFFSCFPFVSPT
jgi:hypothetical protein